MLEFGKQERESGQGGDVIKRTFGRVFGDQEYLGIQIQGMTDLNKVLEQANENLVVSTSKWSTYKKLVEESKVGVPDPEDDPKPPGGRKSFRISEEEKAIFELNKLRQQANIDQQKAIAENEDIILGLDKTLEKVSLKKNIKW